MYITMPNCNTSCKSSGINCLIFCLVDYVCGGELFTHLHQRGRFTEHEGMFYIGEITLALECLHTVSNNPEGKSHF